MTLLEQRYEGALVLAGEGGDILTLNGWKMDERKVTAVDISRAALADTKIKCGSLGLNPMYAFGEAGVIGQMPDVRYNVAHMDFCGGLSVDNCKTLGEVIFGGTSPYTMKPTMIGVTMLKGREFHTGYSSKIVIKAPRKLRRGYAKNFEAQHRHIAAKMMAHGDFNPRELLLLAEQRLQNVWAIHKPKDLNGKDISGFTENKLNGLGSAMIRAMAVQEVLTAMVMPYGLDVQVMDVFGYHSGTTKQQGTPFVTFILAVTGKGHMAQLSQTLVDNFSLIKYHNLTRSLGMAALKHYALDLSEGLPVGQVAKLLDVNPGQVTAWKAHRTMGTYANETHVMKEAGLGFTFKEQPSLTDLCPLGWGINVMKGG